MPDAARFGDKHSCPAAEKGVPHKGGTIIGPCVPSVLIGGLAAATAGDSLTCTGSIDKIVSGSSTVFIGGKPAARVGDSTQHKGVIITGFPAVQIGG